MSDDATAPLAADLAADLDRDGLTIAVAESLTGGLLSSTLAQAGGAATWFVGGVVAYHATVKHDLLDVPRGPVVCEGDAVQMACRAASLLGADVAIAVTGVGGPDPVEGHPPGTVWVAVASPVETTARKHRFAGEPSEICAATVHVALTQALEHVRSWRRPAHHHP